MQFYSFINFIAFCISDYRLELYRWPAVRRYRRDLYYHWMRPWLRGLPLQRRLRRGQLLAQPASNLRERRRRPVVHSREPLLRRELSERHAMLNHKSLGRSRVHWTNKSTRARAVRSFAGDMEFVTSTATRIGQCATASPDSAVCTANLRTDAC